MRFLVSGVGTRGDVQPVLALAVELRRHGGDAVLCVPPNFVDWAGALGFEATPVGVAMRVPAESSAGTAAAPPPKTSDIAGDLIADQFTQLAAAARGSDVIVGAGAYQFAARSVAERLDVPYVNALYAAVSLPTPELAPRPNPGEVWLPGEPEDNVRRWAADAETWNARFLDRINENRDRLDLAPLEDVRTHILGNRPLLAADPVLGPAPTTPGIEVIQTGAWLLSDVAPLTEELELFLEQGEPPVYVGFGSMPAPPALSATLIDAVRAAGRRAIVSRGWAELGLVDDAGDCIAVGDVNQQALFPRVATVVHHGGAGTTTAAARAGVPQVVVPMFSDQFYWATRVRALGIGTSVLSRDLPSGALASALREALAVADRARSIAARITTDGAAVAATEIAARAELSLRTHGH